MFAPWRTSEPPRPGVDNPVSPAGIRRGANRVLPSSWGTSVIRLPCSNPTPAGLLVSDHCDTAAWPLVCKKQRLPRKVFRRSIAWLSDSLSTLRSAGYPYTTQDSLPVAGQALLDGISTRKVPTKGFKVVIYISFPFPKLCLAQRPEQHADHPSRPNLSVKDVASWLGVGEQTVRNLANRGELVRYMIAGMYRFTEEDVRQFVARCRYEEEQGEAAPRPPRPKLKH